MIPLLLKGFLQKELSLARFSGSDLVRSRQREFLLFGPIRAIRYLYYPPADKDHPARMTVLDIPTHGVLINGVLYSPPGSGLHSRLVICHGLPGNEKNLEDADAVLAYLRTPAIAAKLGIDTKHIALAGHSTLRTITILSERFLFAWQIWAESAEFLDRNWRNTWPTTWKLLPGHR